VSTDRRVIADADVAAYAASVSTPSSEALDKVSRETFEWSDRPGLMVDAAEARLLAILVGISAARRILEIGTFTGFSALAMLEAAPPDGRIDTLEVDDTHAARAEQNIAAAGASDRISVHRGPALASLERLAGPYDLAFIDADKEVYPDYYEAVIPRMRQGGLVIADNVLRAGRVLDPHPEDPGARAMRAFNERAARDPRVETVMLTVRDGVSLIRVR
jgi:caffeoyl-CoA O-methyltransferase